MKIYIKENLRVYIGNEDWPIEMMNLIGNTYKVLDSNLHGYYIVPGEYWYIPKECVEIVDDENYNFSNIKWYKKGKLTQERLKTYNELINEQWNDYYGHGRGKHYPEIVDVYRNNPAYRCGIYNDLNTKQLEEERIINIEKQKEIREINKKYKPDFDKINFKYGKIRKERSDEIIREVEDYMIDKLEGKIIYYKKNLRNNNYYNVIGKIDDLKIENRVTGPVGMYYNLALGLSLRITMNNGEIITGYMNNFNHNLFILDNTLKYLNANKGRTITFTGASIENIKKYIKKYPRSKNIDTIYHKREEKLEDKIEEIGIINIPKIGDFITINDKYLLDITKNFQVTFKRIDAVDPYGEEDWSDEIPWE